MSELLPFVLLAVVIGVAAGFSWYAGEKRRKTLGAWAGTRGLSFSPDREHGLDDRYPLFDRLRQGSSRYAYNMMRGAWNGRALQAFDYHYETHSTDSKGRRRTHHHHFSSIILDSDVPLKPLFIRPEGFFDKVTEFFGYDDIDFESAEFSRRFYVKAADKRWAYDVIHQRAMEFLLAGPHFTIQFEPGCVMVCRGSTFQAKEFEQAIEVAAGLLDRLPDYVIKQQQGNVSHG
jgi:hypothetical protein